MVNITPEQVIAYSKEYQDRLDKMSPAERFDAENFSLIGDLPLLKDIPINQKAFLLDLIPGVSRIGKYDIGDLQPNEIEQLNRLILDATKEGQTSGRVTYYDQGGYSDVITKDGIEQLQRQIKSEFENPENVERFLAENPQVDSKTFLKKLNDPEFIIKTFLGSFSFDTDEQGNIVITDSYDTNIGRGDAEQSGRFKRFFTNLLPDKNYPMNVASGIAGLLGSAEGQGTPVEINLGTIEDIKKSSVPKKNKDEISQQLASLD
jgi:hypothetical protein